MVKNAPVPAGRHRRHGFDPWIRKIPWRRAWPPTLVFLPGEFCGQRSLAAAVHRVDRVRHNLSDLACMHAC